nr:uncharacterized protein LOC109407199 [Aedes albopictus]
MRNPVSEPVSTPLLDVDIVQPYPLLGDTSDAANGWEEDDDSLSFTSLELPTVDLPVDVSCSPLRLSIDELIPVGVPGVPCEDSLFIVPTLDGATDVDQNRCTSENAGGSHNNQTRMNDLRNMDASMLAGSVIDLNCASGSTSAPSSGTQGAEHAMEEEQILSHQQPLERYDDHYSFDMVAMGMKAGSETSGKRK